MIYQITPCPAPRQTQSDRWKKRPCVLRYRAFRDEVRLKNVVIENGCHITFFMPMPQSWSKKKKLEHTGAPHQAKPDLDNILKAILDAIFEDDAHIYKLSAEKLWAEKGGIQVESL